MTTIKLQKENKIQRVYTWLYNTSNDNIYILLIIAIGLLLLIFNLDYWKKKTDYIAPAVYKPITKDKFNDVNDANSANGANDANDANDITVTTIPNTTQYTAQIINNIENNLFISEEEKKQWQIANEILDGNQDSLQNTNGSRNVPKNDILQVNSTLFNSNINSGNQNPPIDNYSTVGDYATIDTLGKGLTDTLGGIETGLGYTVLEEQLGKFTKKEIPNPHTYDNTSNYDLGMSANTVSGHNNYRSPYSGSELNDKKINDNHKQPIFLQKDFDGVANIFAPNIIIQNPPLTCDGYPDISYQM